MVAVTFFGTKIFYSSKQHYTHSVRIIRLPLVFFEKIASTKIYENLHMGSLLHLPLWRNWLARSAVNRKVGGSSPPGGDILFWKQCFIGNFFSISITVVMVFRFGNRNTS